MCIYFPRIEDLAGIKEQYELVLAERAHYHVGARFLTGGEKKVYNEGAVHSTLGRLGTFIRVLMPKSTLCSSPHLRPEKVQGYEDYDADYDEDYDADFETTLTEYLQRSVMTRKPSSDPKVLYAVFLCKN